MTMRVRAIAGLVAALASVSMPTALFAREVVVQVDARAGPWDPAATATMPFGRDSGPPVLVKLPDMPGTKVSIYADGTTMSAGKDKIDAKGIEGQAVDDTKGPKGKVYPSLYVPKILYPANLHALVAVFVDANKQVVGRPFVVGEGVRVAIPDGADSLSLGFNDVDFARNSGTLTVTVDLPDE